MSNFKGNNAVIKVTVMERNGSYIASLSLLTFKEIFSFFNLPAPYRLTEYQTKLQETTRKTSHVTEEHVQKLEVRVLRMMFNALFSLSLSL